MTQVRETKLGYGVVPRSGIPADIEIFNKTFVYAQAWGNVQQVRSHDSCCCFVDFQCRSFPLNLGFVSWNLWTGWLISVLDGKSLM
jgi:hypothetical protein